MPSDRTPKQLYIKEIHPTLFREIYSAGVEIIGYDKQGELLYPRDIVKEVLKIDSSIVFFMGGEPLNQNLISLAQTIHHLGSECNKTFAIQTDGSKFNGRFFSIVKYWTLSPKQDTYNEKALKRYFDYSALWQQRKRFEMFIDINNDTDFGFANHIIRGVMGDSQIQTYLVRKCSQSIFAEQWKKYKDSMLTHFYARTSSSPRLVLLN